MRSYLAYGRDGSDADACYSAGALPDLEPHVRSAVHAVLFTGRRPRDFSYDLTASESTRRVLVARVGDDPPRSAEEGRRAEGLDLNIQLLANRATYSTRPFDTRISPPTAFGSVPDRDLSLT